MSDGWKDETDCRMDGLIDELMNGWKDETDCRMDGRMKRIVGWIE